MLEMWGRFLSMGRTCSVINVRSFHKESRKRRNPPKRQKYVNRLFRPDPCLNVLWGRSMWEDGFSYKLYSEPYYYKWQCQTVCSSLFSHTLNRYVSLDVSKETLYDIDDEGGIDNYLENRSDEELNSLIGSRLKRYIADFKKNNPRNPPTYDENGHKNILPTVHAFDLVGFDKILRPIKLKKHKKPAKEVPINPINNIEC